MCRYPLSPSLRSYLALFVSAVLVLVTFVLAGPLEAAQLQTVGTRPDQAPSIPGTPPSNPSTPPTPPAPPQQTAPTPVTLSDGSTGYVANGALSADLSTATVAAFLGANPVRQAVAQNLSDRGLDVSAFSWARVSTPTPAGGDDFATTAAALNSLSVNNGGPVVHSIEIWVGGFLETPSNGLAVALYVANLGDGSQALLGAMIGDNAADSSGVGPDLYAGDFGTPAGQVATPPPANRPAGTGVFVGPAVIIIPIIAKFILCFLRCLVLTNLVCLILAALICRNVVPPVIWALCVARAFIACKIFLSAKIMLACMRACLGLP